MKTGTNTFKRIVLVFASLFFLTILAWADATINEVYLTGTTNSSAGQFVVQTTDDLFYFQGKVYEVYQVNYDDPTMNMWIAVNSEGNCNSFVAYNGQFSFFYACNKYGFGVRKVMFVNPWVHDQFSPIEYQEQSILCCKHKIEKKMAIGTIATYVPLLYIQQTAYR